MDHRAVIARTPYLQVRTCHVLRLRELAYSLPCDVSCRFSIAEAVQHRWVRHNMPDELKTLNNRLLEMSPQVRLADEIDQCEPVS